VPREGREIASNYGEGRLAISILSQSIRERACVPAPIASETENERDEGRREGGNGRYVDRGEEEVNRRARASASMRYEQTKNDEPRWGPDGGQKHATGPKARAPRLNDSPLFFSFFSPLPSPPLCLSPIPQERATRRRVCARALCGECIARVHPRVPAAVLGEARFLSASLEGRRERQMRDRRNESDAKREDVMSAPADRQITRICFVVYGETCVLVSLTSPLSRFLALYGNGSAN